MANGRSGFDGNPWNLAFVAALAVIVVIGVIGFVLVRTVSSPFSGVEREADVVFPELRAQLGDVATVVIEAEDQSVTFTRGANGGWTIAEEDGYPALDARVNKLLTEFGAMPALDRFELDETRMAELGVSDRQAGEGGRYVRLLDGEGEAVKSFIVGRKRSAPGAQNLSAYYLREEGAAEVWLADAELDASTDPLDWLDPEVLSLPREHLAEVVTAPPQGEPVHIQREEPGDAGFVGVNVPEGMDLEGPWVLNELAVPFTAMMFEDVAEAREPLETGGDGQGMVRTFGGVRIWYAVDTEGEGEYWVRFAVEEAPAAPGWRPGEAADGEATAEETDNEAAEDAPADPTGLPREPVESVEALQERLTPWRFRVPEYTARRLLTSLDDLTALGRTPAQGESQNQ